MAAAQMVAAYEARSSSTHSSPTQAIRDIPTAHSTQKKPKDFVLVTVFTDKDGRPDKTETPVKTEHMRFDHEHEDDTSPDLRWSYYEYVGSDARLIGKYFLYAIRGNNFFAVISPSCLSIG